VDFERRLCRGACERSVPHALGEAYFSSTLPHVWVLNQLAVDSETGADELVFALDDLYAAFDHRRALVVRPELGTRLAPAFKAAGWLVQRDMVMALRRERDRGAQPGVAREVDEPTVRAVEAKTIAEDEPPHSPTVAGQLLAGRSALGRAGRARYFVGAAEGIDACHATLYSDGMIAQVEDVGTAKAYRGRGLARAVCSAAVDAALDAGHELVVIAADDDDWPKKLYARLGFDGVGTRWCFTRPGPVSRAPAS
jgi:GNAT superfamily N-acetyltransferase